MISLNETLGDVVSMTTYYILLGVAHGSVFSQQLNNRRTNQQEFLTQTRWAPQLSNK